MSGSEDSKGKLEEVDDDESPIASFVGNAVLVLLFAGPIALKLFDVIDWSWGWVTSPFWIAFSIVFPIAIQPALKTFGWTADGTRLATKAGLRRLVFVWVVFQLVPTAALAILKFSGVIDWAWIWVFTPNWGAPIMIALLYVVGLPLMMIFGKGRRI